MSIYYLTSTARTGGITGDYQLVLDTNSNSLLQNGCSVALDTGGYTQARLVKLNSSGTVIATLRDWFTVGSRAVTGEGYQTSASMSVTLPNIGATEYLAIQMRTRLDDGTSSDIWTWTLAQGVDVPVVSMTVTAYTLQGWDGDEGISWADLLTGDSAHETRVTFVEQTAEPPTVGTLSGQSCNKYGTVSITYTEAGTAETAGLKVYRSNGGAYSQVTGVTVTDNGTTWTIVDPRPSYGTPVVALGGTASYKVKAYNGAGDSSDSNVVSLTVDVDPAQIISEQTANTVAAANNATYLPLGYFDTPYYPGRALFVWATAYYNGGDPDALARVNSQWTYIKSKESGGRFLPNASPTFDHETRTPWYVYQASRMLKDAGQTALADEMLGKAEAWIQAAFLNAYVGYGDKTNAATGKTASLNLTGAIPPYQTIDGDGSSNKELFGMSLIALLCADENSSLSLSGHPTGWSGSDQTWDAILKRSANHGWWAQRTDGTMPHGDADTYTSTGYHTASMYSLVVMRGALGSGWYQRLDDTLTAGGNAFNTLWSTEPNICFYENGTWVGSDMANMTYRDVILDHLGIVNNLEKLHHTSAFWMLNSRVGIYDIGDPTRATDGGNQAQFENPYVEADGFRILLSTLTPFAVVSDSIGSAGTPSAGMSSIAGTTTTTAVGDAPSNILVNTTGSYNDSFAYAVTAESTGSMTEPTHSVLVTGVLVTDATGEAAIVTPDGILTIGSAVTADAAAMAYPPLVTQLTSGYAFAAVADAVGEAPEGVTWSELNSIAYASVATATATAPAPMTMVAHDWRKRIGSTKKFIAARAAAMTTVIVKKRRGR